METIWKFDVPWSDRFTLDIPFRAKLLSYQNQNGGGYLWALVKPDNKKEKRVFHLVGTGNPMPTPIGRFEFIGTAQFSSGALVFHLFEDVI